MNWNFGNIGISFLCAVLILYALWRLILIKNTRAYTFLCWLLISSGLTILQVILVDARVTQSYPILYLFYFPWQFLAPIFFSAFVSSYVGKMREFMKYRNVLLIPFGFFFVLYTLIKINVLKEYSLISEREVAQFMAEWDENLAVLFALGNGIWNYKMIKSYERSLLGTPYKEVLAKTQWIRVMYTLLVCLCIIWILIIIYLNVTKFERSMVAYYPLWYLFLAFYFVFSALADKHLKTRDAEKIKKEQALASIITNFQIEGLNKVFDSQELQAALGSTHDVTGILSYFATSLFDKKSEEDVLWDIVKNAIGKLDLEDCVIYMIDKERNILVQKAAYGNKDKGSKKVLSPIEIPLGKGIVGSVASTGQWEYVKDVHTDTRYITDDKSRNSELAVPIMFKEEVLGILDSEHSEINFFTDRHVFLFQLIAKLTAVKLKQISKKNVLTITNDNGYYKELNYLLETEKIYQNPELSLNSVAERLNISQTYLSQMVNTLTDVNFSEYINTYRVEQSKKFLTHASYSRYPILSIGLEAGFNSKSSFYAAFKKQTGTTPSQYRAKAPFMS